MKKKKLVLEDLKMKSFITDYKSKHGSELKGGQYPVLTPTQDYRLCLSCPSYYLSRGGEVNEHGELINCL